MGDTPAGFYTNTHMCAKQPKEECEPSAVSEQLHASVGVKVAACSNHSVTQPRPNVYVRRVSAHRLLFTTKHREGQDPRVCLPMKMREERPQKLLEGEKETVQPLTSKGSYCESMHLLSANISNVSLSCSEIRFVFPTSRSVNAARVLGHRVLRHSV